MSTVTVTIISDKNKPMNPEYQVLSLDIVKEVNRIPYAQIVLLDGDAAEQKFAISDTEFFDPGKEIEIKLRYEDEPSKEATVFKGIVVKHTVEASEQGLLLIVEVKDAAIKMTRVRKSAVHLEKTDSDVIGTLITNNGVDKGTLGVTQPAHPQLVQYYCTDWDFMLSRAEMNGMVVVAEDGKISLSEIKLSGTPDKEHTFEFGISDIYNFEIEVDANHQFAEVQSVAWDVKEQKLTAATKAADFSLSQGNITSRSLTPAKVAEAVGGKLQALSTPVPLDPKALQAWADGAMIKSRMAMIRGRISVPGVGNLKRLELIKVAGIGERFNGKTLITGIRHRVDLNGWQTDVQFGLSAESFITQPEVMDRPAAGQLPGINGLQIGIVRAFEDPDKEYRVKVMLPGMNPQVGEEVWARLALPYASKEAGFFFIPEIEDEVIVGFLNDDPRQAVIVGSVYNPKNKPDQDMESNSKDNVAKGIVTKKKITLSFLDDEKPMVLIKTPGANQIVLNDKDELVQVSDQHGNTITLNKDGIEIKSTKDVKIEASGNVEIKGAKVDVK